MDIRKVKKLIELLEESNIDEIEIKEGEESVRISRNGAQAMTGRALSLRCAHGTSPSGGGASRARCCAGSRSTHTCRDHQRSRGGIADGWHLLPLPITHLRVFC